MLKEASVLILLCTAFLDAHACQCVGRLRPCEGFQHDAVFVGRVIATESMTHEIDKDHWASGFAMRFRVEETLRGNSQPEMIINTGTGGGDCGTPMPVGQRALIFAYKTDKGELWTGLCSGSRVLDGSAESRKVVELFRSLVKPGTGSVFGHLVLSKPVWNDDEMDDDTRPLPVADITIHAKSAEADRITRTDSNGSYEFHDLPNGTYTIRPELPIALDYSREYEDLYSATISDGGCRSVNFGLKPRTRIRGRVIPPPGVDPGSLEVVALPIQIEVRNQFSGKWSFTQDGSFDLWPLPPGDYYVGININSSPKEDSPFPPTYFPGVTSQEAASIVHLDEGDVRELDIPLPEMAKPRKVSFVAIGLDGKPLRAVYVQLEDLRHPGDAASYVNVSLDKDGKGEMTVYAGYAYHLHASHWVKTGTDWCAKPVSIPAGEKPLNVRFIMVSKSEDCDLEEIDGVRR